MTTEELRLRLKNERVYESLYCFGNTPGVDDCHVITQEENGWHVFYKERGQRIDEIVLASESAACDELLTRILRYPSNRVPITWIEAVWNHLTKRQP